MPVINPEVEQTEILHLYGLHKLTGAPEIADQFLSHMASEEVQTSNLESLKFSIPANTASQSGLNELQKSELEYLSQAKHFVPLFEFNTHPEIAQAALDEFLFFWKNPDRADEVMERMEILRKDIYTED